MRKLKIIICCLVAALSCHAQIKKVTTQEVIRTVEYDTITTVSYAHCLLLAELSPLKDGSYGFKIGVCGKTWGGYAGLNAGYGGGFNFTPSVPEVAERSNVFRKKEGSMGYLGVTGGLLYRASTPLYFYGGLGYGHASQSYNFKGYYSEYGSISPEGSSIHGTNPDFSRDKFAYNLSGLAVEFGAIYRHKHLLLSAGFNTVLGSSEHDDLGYGDVHIGIGVTF